jgi:hypothetical protein
VVEDKGEGAALDAQPHLPRGVILVGRRRAVALVVRQLRETVLRKERRPLVLGVGVPERVVALLQREDLVVVPVMAAWRAAPWGTGGIGIPPALSLQVSRHRKSGDAMYLASYRRRASHSWRYRRPKPFASWPAGCISAAWGNYGVEETSRGGG